MKTFIYSAVALFAAFMLFGFLQTGGSGGEQETSRTAIRLCWEDQSKKSLEPSSARFVAGVCEKLQDEFRAKYGSNP